MSSNYSPGVPTDRFGNTKVGYPPAKVALATTQKVSATVSSVLVFTHDTTEIEVAATGGPVAGKWATITNNGTSVIAVGATANFDFVVPATEVRRFVVPQQTNSFSGSVQGVNRAEGLYQGVAYIAASGVSSVLTDVLTIQF